MRGHLCYVCEERLGFDDDDDDAIIFWGRCFLTYMITRKSAMIVVELGLLCQLMFTLSIPDNMPVLLVFQLRRNKCDLLEGR